MNLTKAFMWCIIKPWLLQHWQSPSTSNSRDLKTGNPTLTACFHLKQILLHIESIYYFMLNVWFCPGPILQLLRRAIDKKAILHEISLTGPVVMKYIQKVRIVFSFFSPSAGSKVKYIACLLHEASFHFIQTANKKLILLCMPLHLCKCERVILVFKCICFLNNFPYTFLGKKFLLQANVTSCVLQMIILRID